jgi:hypothetical protein
MERQGMKPRKYDEVLFQFLSMDDRGELRGTILIRDNQMVIDIPQNGVSTFVIVGSNQEGFYEGHNSTKGAPRVHAHWTKFGPIFAGRWVEDRVEYLFSFRLTE